MLSHHHRRSSSSDDVLCLLALLRMSVCVLNLTHSPPCPGSVCGIVVCEPARQPVYLPASARVLRPAACGSFCFCFFPPDTTCPLGPGVGGY
ncbi:hypothetical protein BO71DRAFT_154999 [Aspergillus ellipticus CBS 707.79]|uniref:Secreted protein n=1 Tax=Aspergillus ellipticus CBS 707.79 TaxID=1448320 RepID=A0A319EYK7_9EURO|nr:hypothetical protein BO71DRAFT_154999 [Aspergillus ellipticus CBS 707.79]